MLQVSIFDSLSFNPLASLRDGLRHGELGIGRCDVAQAFLIALTDPSPSGWCKIYIIFGNGRGRQIPFKKNPGRDYWQTA